MNTDKILLEAQSQPSCLGAVQANTFGEACRNHPIH